MKYIKGTVNHVELLGRLGNDPQERYTPSGALVAEFSIATKRLGGRDDEGTRTYETDWTDVVAWDQLAEFVVGQFRKGSRVLVTGSLRSESWEDRDGNKRKRVYVRAEDCLLLDARVEAPEALVETTI
jgi:single-strand DNA-binding protein